jgi:hypothetical protein
MTTEQILARIAAEQAAADDTAELVLWRKLGELLHAGAPLPVAWRIPAPLRIPVGGGH